MTPSPTQSGHACCSAKVGAIDIVTTAAKMAIRTYDVRKFILLRFSKVSIYVYLKNEKIGRIIALELALVLSLQ